jgi:ATP-dependent DNA helicase DinG
MRARRAQRVRNMAVAIEKISAPTDDRVRWIDQGDKNKRRPTPLVVAQPINVADYIRSMADRQTTIFTSATLAAPDMAHFMRTAGLPQALQMQAASPFDYAANALLYLPAGAAPAPSAPEWGAWAIDQMRALVLASGGGAFLLFTSYRMMQEAVAQLRPLFAMRRLTVLVQGDMPKMEIARRFRDDGSAVLFATKSFFEGVSIDGSALRLVVVDKMPFEAPSPLTMAMEADLLDKARAAGMSGKTLEMHPFNALRVPRMVIELKQALGRLIRTQTDQGAMAVLDSRVRSAMYGRNVVIPSLPPAQLVSRIEHVAAFLAAGATAANDGRPAGRRSGVSSQGRGLRRFRQAQRTNLSTRPGMAQSAPRRAHGK